MDRSEEVAEFLAKTEVHEEWEDTYRTPENEAFYELTFDRITEVLDAERDADLLDVGCGPAYHGLRLARRGFIVRACDFSPPIVDLAKRVVSKSDMAERVSVERQDLLDLKIDDGSQSYIMCWGVLMHIPDVESAISELVRVLAPGGTIVVCENNASSLQSVADRTLKKVLRRTTGRRHHSGIEHWQERDTGRFVTREADIDWLTAEFEKHGAVLTERLPCQFTELYTKLSPGRAQRLVHRFNWFWFNHTKAAKPAAGNVLFFEKK